MRTKSRTDFGGRLLRKRKGARVINGRTGRGCSSAADTPYVPTQTSHFSLWSFHRIAHQHQNPERHCGPLAVTHSLPTQTVTRSQRVRHSFTGAWAGEEIFEWGMNLGHTTYCVALGNCFSLSLNLSLSKMKLKILILGTGIIVTDEWKTVSQL